MLIGIDVAKAKLVVGSRPNGERWTVANDERGVGSLVDRLREEKPELTVLETDRKRARRSANAVASAETLSCRTGSIAPHQPLPSRSK